ncbi:MAG TPA: MarR family transcriptional regulator [Candidatus Saccharimonadales bacterium]|nr:MarR family transcriptional regulator [Candidatus Saccharimonadales bacterium]
MSAEESFIIFIKFLMLSKHRVIELGSKYELTAMQTLTLFLLDQPCPMHGLRKVFNCDASNITGLVDGLEQKELASRYEHPQDRRIKMVRLEERGREVRRALLRQLGKQDGPVWSRLTPAEYRTLIQLLQKVTQEA